MTIEQRVKQYLLEGKTQGEAINLAYNDFYTRSITQPELAKQVENFNAFDYQDIEELQPKYQQGGEKYTQDELNFIKELQNLK